MVVAPKSTLGNWMNEINRFCPVLRAVKFLGNPEERVSSYEFYRFMLCVMRYAVEMPVTLNYFHFLVYAEVHKRGIVGCWEV